jgi:hypothetical protein
MITEYFLLILFLFIMFAVWNITAIKWKETKSRAWNRAFHAVGLFVKLPPLMYIYPNIGQALIYAIVVWIVYDMVISLGIAKVPFLVGTTSRIDKLLGGLKFIFQAILIIITVLYLIFY